MVYITLKRVRLRPICTNSTKSIQNLCYDVSKNFKLAYCHSLDCRTTQQIFMSAFQYCRPNKG